MKFLLDPQSRQDLIIHTLSFFWFLVSNWCYVIFHYFHFDLIWINTIFCHYPQDYISFLSIIWPSAIARSNSFWISCFIILSTSVSSESCRSGTETRTGDLQSVAGWTTKVVKRLLERFLTLDLFLLTCKCFNLAITWAGLVLRSFLHK